ncbi:uncharacterized protein LOC105200182 [Solenopsis invicta]|nr:uncharacterized protein LOC105200182 [Solenopsis invicta]XP_025993866.1 uncharacterized protein LOC105200182 [Solenopsis invicta]XP_025993867.1 uncharacterized protein LOC105200182 [Solenopsis invicta]
MVAKVTILQLLFLLIFYDHVTSLIIPEELPTILSLIYSNIPPIKKGTDSRLGVGFRLGEHADFQILIELGPQTETDPIGTSNDAKRRRDATFSAAMKGQLGPLAQAVAKYQLERGIQKEMDKLKAMEEKLKKDQMENTKDQKENTKDQKNAKDQKENTKDKDIVPSEWLTKWRKEISQMLKDDTSLSSAQNGNDKIVQQRIEKPQINDTTFI